MYRVSLFKVLDFTKHFSKFYLSSVFDKDYKKRVVDRLEVSLVKMSLNLKLTLGTTFIGKIFINFEINGIIKKFLYVSFRRKEGILQ